MNKKLEFGIVLIGSVIGSSILLKMKKKMDKDNENFNKKIEQDAENLVNEAFPKEGLFNFDLAEMFGL